MDRNRHNDAPMFRNLDGALGSRATAEVLVPMLIDRVGPSSVLDLGAGVGSFLRAFIERGVTDVAGVDLCQFDPALFVVDAALIEAWDLNEPVDRGRRFDLAMSLEVGGYLPDHDVLVDSLVRHAPVVVLSSAVPCQDLPRQQHGAYPSAWAARFASRDYAVVDVLRPALWNDDRLPVWFRQNVLLFVHQPYLDEHPELAVPPTASPPLDIVHPLLYETMARTDADAPLKHAIARVRRIVQSRLARRVGRS